MELAGQHALVTGGGTGIGLAIAQALAGAGVQVTITGRRADVLEDASGGNLFPLVMDVTSEDSVVDGVTQASKARGKITICVANAGIAEGGALVKSDLTDWRKILSTNLDGAFLTMREVLRGLDQDDWARVIGISSIAGIKGLKGAPAYTASKHGLVGLIRGLSEDYLGSSITFNALCPGYVDTDIVTQNVERIKARAGVGAEEAMAIMVEANRHKRLIDPSEVATAALWLCAPGSESVNGQCIEIFGGQT